MKNFFITLSVFALCLISAPQLWACGSTTVTGPTACGSATVAFGTPISYTANTTTSSSACTVFEWRITGGVESTTGSAAVNVFETIGCATSNCLIGPGIPCIPGSSASTSTIGIIWTAGAAERSINVTVRELGTIQISSSGSLLIDRVIAPSSVSQLSKSCSGGTYRVNMPSSANSCPPDGFNWFLNGSSIGFTTSNTRSVNVSNLQSSFSVGAQAVFDGRASSTTTSNFSALVQNDVIVGPSTVCAGSTNAFNVSINPGLSPSSVQWQASTTQITFSHPNSTSTDLFVGGSPPSSFSLSCTTVTCGITDVTIRTINVGTPGSGSCPPIPRDGETVSSLVADGIETEIVANELLGSEERAVVNQVEVEHNDASLLNQTETTGTIFPNPVKLGEVLYLPNNCATTEVTHIDVLDAMGKMVNSVRINDAFNYEFSTKDIPMAGTYFIRISNDCGSNVFRAVIVE